MTCEDCIHYHSIGTLCDKSIYPEERKNNVCDHYNIEVDADAYRICAKMEVKEMTCKDCKYFNSHKHPPMLMGADNTEKCIYGYCEKRVAEGYCEYPSPDAEICDMFEPTYESVGNALDALDSWESVSK